MRVTKVRASLIAVAAASLVTTVLAQQPPAGWRARSRRSAGAPAPRAAGAVLRRSLMCRR